MEKLTHKLNVYQGNIIGCLWKNPELYADSNINKKDLNPDGLLYYSLGERLYVSQSRSRRIFSMKHCLRQMNIH